MRLQDKVAVVTGAGSGVGRATALRFLQEGAKVVAADLQPEWLAATAELAGDRAALTTFACDVAREPQVEAAVRHAAETYGRLDIMHNNVGITGLKPGATTDHYDDEEWQRLLAVNVSSVFYGCKYAIKQFKVQRDGGVILNTGSIAGIVGFGSVLYGATKAAVNQLTKGLAIEWAKRDIRVNAICPGAMPLTNFSANPGEKFKAPDSEFLDMVAAIQPREVNWINSLGLAPLTADDVKILRT